MSKPESKTTKHLVGIIYMFRQLRLLLMGALFGLCVKLTPVDCPEFHVLSDAATELYYACKKHESYTQFKKRVS